MYISKGLCIQVIHYSYCVHLMHVEVVALLLQNFQDSIFLMKRLGGLLWNLC